MQNLKTFEKALKEYYLPVWRNQLGTEPSALLGKIKKRPLISDKIVASAPIGLSGGFGFSEEGMQTPKAGGVKFERFITNPKDMYVNVVISAKAVELTGSGGAMANALDTEVKGAYETAKWNVGRSLFGNGTGVLCQIRAATTYSSGITTIKVNDVSYLKEGLTVDLYAAGGSTPDANGTALRISSISRVGESFTPSGGSAETVYAVTLTGASANTSIAAVTVSSGESSGGGFVTVQNSYNREMTGLGAIFDDDVTTLYGVNKESNPFIKPVVMDAEGSLEDGVFTKALRRAKNDKNSNIDMMLLGDDAYDHYIDYLRTNNIRVEDISHTVTGGFKAIKFIFGNKEVDVVNESFVPTNEAWGVDSTTLELHQKEWKFAELQGGGIFNLMENQSTYRALLINYGDLICTNPGGCVRITGCSQ